MTPNQKNPDITIRGGLINVPSSTKSKTADRHRPNTPPTKKVTKTRTDHIPAPRKDAAPIEPPSPEPEGDENNVPAQISQGY